MSKMVNIRIVILGIISIVASAFFSPLMATSAEGPIKVGVLYTKTGFLAEHGRQAEMGIKMAIEELNAQGGVLDRKIEAVWRDNQAKAEVSGREANALIFEEKVDFLLGGLLGSTGSAISAVSKEHKLPYIVLSQTASLTMEGGHRYVFRGISNSIYNSRGVVTNLKGRGFRTAWTITYDYGFGHQIIASTKEYMEKVTPEIKIVGESWPPLGEMDYTGYISQMMRAKPDVVIAYIFGTGMASFMTQAKPYGFFDQIKLALDCNPDNIRPVGINFRDDIIGYAFYDISMDTPRNKTFVKNFHNRFGEYPAFTAAVFYTGLYSIATAIKNAGTTEHEAVIDALEKSTVPSPFGEIKYRQCDHQGTFPVVVGETAMGPDKKWYYIGRNVRSIPAEELWPSCEDVMAARKAKTK
jgi:branched-chain amino acid transport system substrate-binding protein